MKLNNFFNALLLTSWASVPIDAFSIFEDINLQETFGVRNRNIFKNEVQSIIPKNWRFKNDFETTIESTIDQDYSLRVRSVDPAKLQIDSVNQWSGYLDYKDSKHFFYWFFESRNDPKNDPLILWLNGGPGCSSFTGLLFELGPSSIGPDMKPIHNPYSWNNNASVIFLEQPLGVGFSYGDEKVTSTNVAGKDVYIFLELFFKKFPHLRDVDFHIAGESYAGHYIPQIAHEIVQNPLRTFNLSSIMIGNGITDPLIQSDYYRPMACGEGGHKSLLSQKECDDMVGPTNRCHRLNQVCYLTESNLPCVVSSSYCETALMRPFEKTGLNPYDIRGPCEDNSKGGLCYNGIKYVEKYMNFPEVQEVLGSDVDHYSGCNEDVFTGFFFTGDGSKPFQGFVGELLDMDIPVLIYAGDKDFICNWLGNQAWTKELEWKYDTFYELQPLKPWIHSETREELGEVKNYGPLTFLRVYESGHMVPYDQPEASLEMLNVWLSGKRSFRNGNNI
ncbi:carboxypeptidase C NDAI_0A06870 [Naumovozyma dairenensis CBS 421]|uniref:Carboxypeptidase n=1 Tax=Naumovozyma dairenensis (strain ATCC 10597 / BCRC 20456 / CBS 421 / NBRC 0211 / NRRL Y-12639) TaxID=1071378 RepID=G0W4V3_NAUDC|nr:hypothetical protein NDAI_0A06870 [Naumovozyma dairenensis CBS 421]CCD22841.1 hypothetical protein NDAI_0A06870 [Naumovozyma dairenensis CBS 421]